MEKRGQAAMEFLMTYGWAILAAIIAIAVLAYFGVFNPGRYTSETCALSPPFTCGEDSLVDDSANDLELIVRNGGDDDAIVTNIKVTNCNAAGTDYDPAVPAESLVGSGTDKTFSITCDDVDLVTGASFRGNIDITYTKASGTRILTSTGSITRKKVIA